MSRGMTLLEVLISLALLSALSLASLGWTQVARDLAGSAEPLSWTSAAENALEQMGLDLTTGDFSRPDDEQDPRVIATAENVLRIRTRSRTSLNGEVIRGYARHEDGRVIVSEGSTGSRTLLDRVDRWDCRIELRHGDRGNAKEQWLVVALTSSAGLVRSRSFFLGTQEEPR